MTYNVVVGTALSLVLFCRRGDQGRCRIERQLPGPVGIARHRRQRHQIGFVYFEFYRFSFHQFGYYQHLAVSGFGRRKTAVLLIEKNKGSPVSSRISSVVHGIGMAILLTLMLMVTYRDILKLF